MNLKVYTDGGARGNPGPAGIGIIIKNDDKIIAKIKKYIGEATNNQAEYQAILSALEFIKANYVGKIDSLLCSLDSQLVVEQLRGNYKVKNQDLAILFLKIKKICEDLDLKIEFVHIPREQNKLADKLVNIAIDEKSDFSVELPLEK
ncbi:MAG: ribonuclease HI family protein [Patescibacteria group bacterium]|jgi:ribonuclease HI